MLNALRQLLLLIAFIAVLPANAQDAAPEPEPPRPREDAGDRVREVERDGGQVLQAEPMQREGREVYRLKVLTPEGRIRVLHDDSAREAARDSRRDERPRYGRGEFGDAGRQSPMRLREASPEPGRRDAPPPPAPSQAPPPPPGGGNPPGRY
jgi:hypothetical protein